VRANAGDAPTVVICVATHRRPRGLERLLIGLDALIFKSTTPRILAVVVVDNDPGQSAAATCTAHTKSPWPIEYVSEPRRGIPFARNAGVYAGRRKNADYLAFIDDDEVPEPNWLDELFVVARDAGVDIVTGPVLPEFESDVPPWIRRGGFFDRERHQTGILMDRAVTGNVLMRTSLLAAMPAPFDERIPLSGGSDTHLFSRLRSHGHRIAWANDAIVYEWNPAGRLAARWLVRRAFRVSANWSRSESEFQPGLKVRSARIAKALFRIAQGAALLPVGIVAGRHVFVKSGQLMATGAGFIAGITGHELDEYRTTLGS
jgi:succinoglycan biosynthesis protein ExoM